MRNLNCVELKSVAGGDLNGQSHPWTLSVDANCMPSIDNVMNAAISGAIGGGLAGGVAGAIFGAAVGAALAANADAAEMNQCLENNNSGSEGSSEGDSSEGGSSEGGSSEGGSGTDC